jgi:hypothetical protein
LLKLGVHDVKIAVFHPRQPITTGLFISPLLRCRGQVPVGPRPRQRGKAEKNGFNFAALIKTALPIYLQQKSRRLIRSLFSSFPPNYGIQ